MFASQAIAAGPSGVDGTHGAVVELLRRGKRAVLLWRRRRRAVTALHALTDRALEDMGVARSEIEAFVEAHLRGAPRSAC